MRILFKFPTRERADKMVQHVNNIKKFVGDIEYEIVLSLDSDDTESISKADGLPVILDIGDNTNNDRTKIKAYNSGIDKVKDWDILIVTSDDMEWIFRNFGEEIALDVKNSFPDLDGFLHYSDGNQKANICTLPIMTRKYYDRFGYVYHPSYRSLWCDNEQTDVAKYLKRYRYMGDQKILFKHYHPAWGFGQMDRLYLRNESRLNWCTDEANYIRRKENNFGL